MTTKKLKIYIATPMDQDKRKLAIEITNDMRRFKDSLEVYAPWEHEIEHAWDWPNDEWGLMVFENDVAAIQEADWVVVLSWGRKDTTAGTAWEQGFAFGLGKKVLLVEMTRNTIQSLMMANGRYSTIIYNEGIDIAEYLKYNADFPEIQPFQLRTNTEQK